jgi:hypothetical protein
LSFYSEIKENTYDFLLNLKKFFLPFSGDFYKNSMALLSLYLTSIMFGRKFSHLATVENTGASPLS